jgi:hypothetical protein
VSASRVAAFVAATVLARTGLLHVMWGLDMSTWPFASRSDLAAAVMNLPVHELPPGWTNAALGALLCVAGGVVLGRIGACGRRVPGWVFAVGIWIVAGVLLLRGASGLLTSGLFVASIPTPYARWDAAVYSPAALVVGVLCVFVALSSSRRRSRGRRRSRRRTTIRGASTTSH